MTNTNKKINQLKEQTKTKSQQAIKKVKEAARSTAHKIDQAQKSPLGKKIKKAITKTAKIATAHLATLKTALTLSNQESELIIKLQADLNKKEIYPSKSEIIRAAVWSLRNKKTQELEEIIKDLVKVKQIRVL
ncbi:MAG: hypothetical protein mread185_000603 [Mycoplasmataceae bacterium]|nr:MAG: hypothetical protein mread185_000603 [Mycoplasmataceae bacterium]